MTMHSMRGSSGIIKQLYTFHANVVCSCDMGIFMAISGGAVSVADSLKQTKIDACQKMRLLLLAQLKNFQVGNVVQWVWLYDAWMHHLDFHIGIMETIRPPDETAQFKPPNCKWDDIQI